MSRDYTSSHLVKKTTATASAYSYTPSHVLNPSRLLQSKPFFLNMTDQAIEKPKIIIVCNVTKLKWEREQPKIVLSRLNKLADSQFTIHFYKDGVLSSATENKKKYRDSVFRPRNYSIYPEIAKRTLLEELTNRLEVSEDDLFILNEETLDEFLEGGDEDWMYLKSFKTVNLQGSNLSFSSLMRLLQTHGCEIEYLNLSQCKNLKGKQAPENLNLSNLKEFIADQTSLSTEIIESILNASKQLKTLSLQYSYPSEKILDLLKTYTNVESIHLGGWDLDEGILATIKEDFSKSKNNAYLKSLVELDCSVLSKCHEIWSLLENAPRLKILSIVAEEPLDDDSSRALPRTSVCLPDLETLILCLSEDFEEDFEEDEMKYSDPKSYPSNNIQFLSQILCQADKLTTLELSRCNIFQELPSLNLTHLKRVKFSEVLLSPLNLTNILSKTNQLAEFSLDYGDMDTFLYAVRMKTARTNLKFKDVVSNTKINFSSVTSLTIWEDIPLSCLELFPYLEHLTWQGIDFRNQEKIDQPFELKHLKSLVLTESEFKYSLFCELVSRASQLEKIVGVLLNDSEKPTTVLKLPHLKEIRLGSDNNGEASISYQNLCHLLSATTKLDSLILKNLKVTRDEIPHSIAGRWPEVGALTLKRIDMDGQIFCDFLSHLRGLKEIDIDFLKLVSPLSQAPQLNALHYLAISNTSVQIMYLLANAKHLKKLNLSHVTAQEKPDLTPVSTSNDFINLDTLQALKLQSCELSQEFLNCLNFSILQVLDYQSTMPLPEYWNLSQLKRLMVPANWLFSGNSLPMNKLCSLTLTGGGGAIPKDGPLDMVFPHLTTLELDNIYSDENSWLTRLLSSMRILENLKIDRCGFQSSELTLDFHLSHLNVLTVGSSRISPLLIGEIRSKASPSVKLNLSMNSDNKSQINQTTRTLDADTTPRDTTFKLETLFWAHPGKSNPKPQSYRLASYNTGIINDQPCPINQAFVLENTPDLELQEVKLVHSEEVYTQFLESDSEDNCYYAKTSFLITPNQDKSLPSLDPNEEMLYYNVKGASHETIKINYSRRDSMYYLTYTGHTDAVVTIEYVVNTPPRSFYSSLSSTVQEAMKPYLDLLKQISAYTAKSLNITTQNSTGVDYLRDIIDQKTGACRHRSMVFKTLASSQQHFPSGLPVRIINNVCHSYVEVRVDVDVNGNGIWLQLDLGGYPAKFEINNALDPSKATTFTSEKSLEEILISKTGNVYFPDSKSPVSHDSSLSYIQKLLDDKEKILLQLDSLDLKPFRYAIQEYCMNTTRRCFYVDTPYDLICSHPYLEFKNGNEGISKKGPGGPLYDFLTQNSDSKRILMVNYNNFTSNDLVQFNNLLDSEGFAENTPLPSTIKIVGLIDPNKPGVYEGADFYSRFDKIEQVPIDLNTPPIPALFTEDAVSVSEDLSSTYVNIELYGGMDWEERLIGQWEIEGQKFTFVEGELLLALKSHCTHIHLQNPPLNNDDFERFLQEARLYKEITYYGRKIPFPKTVTLRERRRYSFHHITEQVTICSPEVLPEDTLVLNSGVLSSFFREYYCDPVSHSIHHLPGILNEHRGKTLTIYLSHSLSLSSFALFLRACTEARVTISLILGPNVVLPSELGLPNTEPFKASVKQWTLDTELEDYDLSFCSTDYDTTLKIIPLNQAYVAIDVSNLDFSALFSKLEGKFDSASNQLQFSQTEGFVTKALRDNRIIILKGDFSEDLQCKLTELLLQRQQKKGSGRLILMSSQSSLFPFISTYNHQITIADKNAALKLSKPPLLHVHDPAEMENLSYVKLMALSRSKFLYKEKEQLLQSPWEGMHSLPPTSFAAKFEFGEAEEISTQFNQERINSLFNVLEISPFAFIAGMTGVGKTTFVEDIVGKKMGALIFMGEKSVTEWAKSLVKGFKILFIDEANLAGHQWNEFESLYNEPPGILVGNEYIELTEQHKIVFAGNPLSYGGGRHMPSFFENHGNSVIFKPMPLAYIYHEILLPVFKMASFSEEIDIKNLATPILNVASALMSWSENEVLITPRELTMMALLTVTYYVSTPDLIIKPSLSELSVVASYYAFFIANNFVPSANQAQFVKKFKPVWSPIAPDSTNVSGLLINSSNEAAYLTLNDYLDLRALRRNKADKLDHQQLYGGLGGLIIEGEPGLGKSELVIKTLLTLNFTKASLEQDCSEGDFFFHLPVSTSVTEKLKLLNKAFDEGAVVLIDEINSTLFERVMNHLLMGKAEDGRAPKKPGFLVIGTQNPPTMSGRLRASRALQHRMQTVTISPYTREEMIQILSTQLQLPDRTSNEIVDEYLLRKNSPSNQRTLCFRDLLKRAKYTAEAYERQAQQSSTHSDTRVELLEEKPAPLDDENTERRSILADASFFSSPSGYRGRLAQDDDSQNEESQEIDGFKSKRHKW